MYSRQYKDHNYYIVGYKKRHQREAKQESGLCNNAICMANNSKEEDEEENVDLVSLREKRPTWDANCAKTAWGNIKYL